MTLVNIAFILLLISTLLKPIYDFPIYLLGYSFNFIHQFICVVFVAIGITFLLSGKSNYKNILVTIFFISLITAILSTFLNDEFKIEYLYSQIFYYVMPIIVILFGQNISIENIENINLVTEKLIKIIFWFLVLLTIIYFVLYKILSIWNYYGYSTGLIFAYSLIEKRDNKYLIGFVFDIFSGKRSSIILWYLYFFKSKFKYFLLITTLTIAFLYFNLDELPIRYQNVINVDITDDLSLFNATGGRSVEWSGILDKIFSDYQSMLIGSGFGSSYLMNDFINDDIVESHYSHMTPFTYALISGAISSFLIYSILTYKIYNFWKIFGSNRKFDYIFLMFLVSFSGPSLLVEPLPWFFVGMLMGACNER